MPSNSTHGIDVAAKPLVSAIVPTRNRAHCLPRALNSVYAQEGLGEHFHLEVIVVDDASSDTTSEVMRRYPSARYLRLAKARGVSAVMNEGLRVSRGVYLSFLGDDDEWLPHKLRVQVPLLQAHPDVGVVYGQRLVRFEGNESLRPAATKAPSGRVFMAMLMENFCGHHASLLARREAFDKAGEFDESLATYEDYDMSLRLAFHTRFLFAPGAVDVYNLSAQGTWLSRAADGAGADDAVRVIEKALGMLPDSAEYQATKQEARTRVVLETALRIRDPVQAWARVVAMLRAYPAGARYDWVQSGVSVVGGRRALAAAAPIPVARDLCAEIDAATAAGRATERRSARRMVAAVWAEIARSRINRREAACAAARTVIHAPAYLLRKSFLRVIVRLALGRRVEALALGVYGRLWRIGWSAPMTGRSTTRSV